MSINWGQLQRRHITNAEAFYAEHKIPIKAFGSMVHKSELYAQAHLVQHPDLPIWCCNGDAAEYSAAVEALKSATSVVIDVTSLTTLLLLGLPKAMRALGKNLLVTHSTLALIQQFSADTEGKRRSSGTLSTTDDGPILFEPAQAEKDSDAQKAAAFLKEVSTLCKVTGCRALAAVSPEEKETFEQVCGASVLESAVVATQPATIVWSDDGVASHHLQHRFGAKRIWTQAVLHWLNDDGLLSDDDYNDASMRLMSFNYRFTSVGPATMRAAGNQARWNVNASPLGEAVNFLALESISPESAALLAASLVAACYLDSSITESRQAMLIRAAESISRRPNAAKALRQFGSALRSAFGINLIGLNDATMTFATWLKEFGRRVH